MSAYDVERAYKAWAREAQFVEYEGEAFYHGTIDGHVVRVDDGSRTDRCYPVQVWVAVEVTEPRGVIDPQRAETTPARIALCRIMMEEKRLVSARLDDAELSLSFEVETPPAEMARVTTRVVEACRVVPPPAGIYR